MSDSFQVLLQISFAEIYKRNARTLEAGFCVLTYPTNEHGAGGMLRWLGSLGHVGAEPN